MKQLPLCLAMLGLLAACGAQDSTLTARNQTGCGELNAVCCQLQLDGEPKAAAVAAGAGRPRPPERGSLAA